MITFTLRIASDGGFDGNVYAPTHRQITIPGNRRGHPDTWTPDDHHGVDLDADIEGRITVTVDTHVEGVDVAGLILDRIVAALEAT